MKNLKIASAIMILVLVLTMAFTGCKKNTSTPVTSNTESLTQLSNDQSTFQSANDEAQNDINSVLSNGQVKSTDMWPCNANIDSANVVNDTITYYITYHGLNCPGTRYRTGKIEVKKHVGTKWWQPGATVIVTYIDFKITRVVSGKSMTFNGTHTYENVTGGLLFQLGTGMTSITHKAWGAVTVTFDDNTSAVWNLARQDVFTGSPTQLVLTYDGFGTSGTYNNLVTWGINRNSEQFYIQVNQSVVHRQVCDWDPCAGIGVIAVPGLNKGATLTFGYNNLNQPITGDECPTKFKVDWYFANQSGTIYLFLP